MAGYLEGQDAEMDHAYIDEHQVAERYLQGRLPAAEASLFAEHSLWCAECLDRLEAAGQLGRGLRAVAAQEIAAQAVERSLWARIVRSRPAAAGMLLLFLAAVLPSGLLWRQVGGLRGELAATLAALRAQADEQRRQLAAERGARAGLAAELASSRAPHLNLPVVSLSPERSAAGGEPGTRLALQPADDWVVLSLELEAVDHASYRVTLGGPDGAALWQGDGLRPSAQDTLTVALPASRLASGRLTARVEASAAGGKTVPVASYTFRVERIR